MDLLRWKRAWSTERHRSAAADRARQVPHHSPGTGDRRLPADLADWFERLIRLEGLPFDHLVPDQRMLPPESLRYFTVDRGWLECLVDGAFSVGRSMDSDREDDRLRRELLPPLPVMSGYLLRSSLVPAYPGLQAMVYDHGNKDRVPLRLVARRTLAPDLVLALYTGDEPAAVVRRVHLYMARGMTHHGRVASQPARETVVDGKVPVGPLVFSAPPDSSMAEEEPVSILTLAAAPLPPPPPVEFLRDSTDEEGG